MLFSLFSALVTNKKVYTGYNNINTVNLPNIAFVKIGPKYERFKTPDRTIAAGKQ